MKVLYVHHSTYFGGSSKSLSLILPLLEKEGVEIHIVTPEGPIVDYFMKFTSNVTVLHHHHIPMFPKLVGRGRLRVWFHYLRYLRSTTMIESLSKVIDEVKPDIIHCNEILLGKVAEIAKRKGYPVVMHCRTMIDTKHWAIGSMLRKKVERYADHVICISGSVKNSLSVSTPQSIIYNPIVGEESNKVNISSDKVIRFSSLSAFSKTKGIFEILKAALQLKNDNRVVFQIGGACHLTDVQSLSPAKRALFRVGVGKSDADRADDFIKRHALNNIVLVGHVDDLKSFFSTTDVVLAPMHLNAPPRSVYEAGRFGIPAILAMRDKVEDVVEHGVNGFLIDEKSTDQLVLAIRRFVDDPRLVSDLGNAARVKFLQNHDLNYCSKQVLDVYRAVLGSKNTYDPR